VQQCKQAVVDFRSNVFCSLRTSTDIGSVWFENHSSEDVFWGRSRTDMGLEAFWLQEWEWVLEVRHKKSCRKNSIGVGVPRPYRSDMYVCSKSFRLCLTVVYWLLECNKVPSWIEQPEYVTIYLVIYVAVYFFCIFVISFNIYFVKNLYYCSLSSNSVILPMYMMCKYHV
jgi:hypothetical protein